MSRFHPSQSEYAKFERKRLRLYFCVCVHFSVFSRYFLYFCSEKSEKIPKNLGEKQISYLLAAASSEFTFLLPHSATRQADVCSHELASARLCVRSIFPSESIAYNQSANAGGILSRRNSARW
jgi:hypothetical protein